MSAAIGASSCLQVLQFKFKLGVMNAGPRRPGEGTENEEQGIVNAELLPGGVSLHITLLAAGFIIGAIKSVHALILNLLTLHICHCT